MIAFYSNNIIADVQKEKKKNHPSTPAAQQFCNKYNNKIIMHQNLSIKEIFQQIYKNTHQSNRSQRQSFSV